MPRDAYLEHLAKVPLFHALKKKDLRRVAKAADEVQVTAGTLLVDQGQTGREAFVLVSGTVEVKRNGRKVATLGPGAVFGEMSLLDHGPRTASVTCIDDCTLLVLTQRDFLGVLDEVPEVSHQLLSSLAMRVRQLDRQYYG
jgi:CRP/FNR family transcriptional regulator, cyclic AMP receptor protein